MQVFDERLKYAHVLSKAQHSAEVVTKVFLNLKREKESLTLAVFGKKIGLKSDPTKLRKVVNDIMKGRRRLPANAVQAFCKTADFHPFETMAFKALIESESHGKQNVRESSLQLFHKIKELFQRQKADLRSPSKEGDWNFGLRVLAAFSIASDGAGVEKSDLIAYFGKNKSGQIDEALELLTTAGAIQRRGRKFVHDSQTFYTLDANVNKIRFYEVIENIDHWFRKPGEAFFNTSNVAILESDYKLFIEEIRKAIFPILMKYDRSNHAEMLAEINLAVTPIYRSAK